MSLTDKFTDYKNKFDDYFLMTDRKLDYDFLRSVVADVCNDGINANKLQKLLDKSEERECLFSVSFPNIVSLGGLVMGYFTQDWFLSGMIVFLSETVRNGVRIHYSKRRKKILEMSSDAFEIQVKDEHFLENLKWMRKTDKNIKKEDKMSGYEGWIDPEDRWNKNESE
ncbi:hypothetical protein COV11_00155 [Candidatus Woesearchaeota archaeon CG10_big_fil_rev_8_21_14_0_10_30_7]|nr:MAG: hypothetical protein COV11_00155 [Candidatus Woesearchaeota archaeon CG10_big_fil_rev_8_21_14_0_10_30_7]